MGGGGFHSSVSALREGLRAKSPISWLSSHAILPAVVDSREAEALLAAVARDRDQVAFAQLFRHYAPRIKAYVIARGISPGVGEELAQEIMLRVWRKAATFNPERGGAATWIFTVARNAFINHVRREGHPEAEMDDPVLVGWDAAPEQQVAAAQSQAALINALGALPAEQQQALRGAYFRGQTMCEIAEEQSVPVGTVKTRVRLALERLRQMLAATKVGT